MEGRAAVSDIDERWVRRYVDLARHVAQWSKDPSTKVGAVIVGQNRRDIVLGFNGFPPGLRDTEERLNDRAVKHLYTQHAERNAIDNARFDCTGGTLVTTLFPCEECAKSIISRGIARVVTIGFPEAEPWRTKSQLSASMFEEAGVEIKILKD